jgi:hypothetical protein
VTISALPTVLDGVNYKSRTEARWAVFFKTLDLPFEYEPEGFELEDGTWYLPDFFLPSVKFWAECKPTYLLEGEERKCRMLAAGTGWPCLFLIGPPDFKSYRGATWDCGNYTVCEYSLDIDANYKATKEGRLYSQPNYSLSPNQEEFSKPYQHAVYASRGYEFGGR